MVRVNEENPGKGNPEVENIESTATVKPVIVFLKFHCPGFSLIL